VPTICAIVLGVDTFIKIRVTAADKAEFQKEAARQGATLSEWMRAVLWSAVQPPKTLKDIIDPNVLAVLSSKSGYQE
jgi:hypothetical protein